MEVGMLVFTEDEVQEMDKFGEFLMRHASLTSSFPQAIQLNKHLSAYTLLRNKIAAHVLEIRKVIPPTPAPAEPESRSSKKSK